MLRVAEKVEHFFTFLNVARQACNTDVIRTLRLIMFSSALQVAICNSTFKA